MENIQTSQKENTSLEKLALIGIIILSLLLLGSVIAGVTFYKKAQNQRKADVIKEITMKSDSTFINTTLQPIYIGTPDLGKRKIDTLYLSDNSWWDNYNSITTTDESQLIRLKQVVDSMRELINVIYVYNDTLTDDSSYYLTLQDKLKCGEIVKRSIFYKDLSPTQIITNTIDASSLKERFKFYVNASFNYSQIDKNIGAGVGFTAIPKWDVLAYSYNYDIVRRTHQMQLGFKISFKKNK